MNNLKFRAWDKINKKMIYPCSQSNDTYLVFEETGWFIVDHFTGKNETILTCENGELMQFTGLYDKKGTEIYQGDIVDQDSLDTIVKYGIQQVDAFEGVGFNLWEFYGDSKDKGKAIRLQKSIKVVGNIYETKKKRKYTNNMK